MKPSFTYAAKVERVVDADTIDVELDLGMRVYVRTRLRVAHIDAPEMRTMEGKDAARYVEAVLADLDRPGCYLPVVVETQKPDKFGRALADVRYRDDAGQWNDLAQVLISAGHARPYEGGAR
jgi:micrococcal nuclease